MAEYINLLDSIKNDENKKLVSVIITVYNNPISDLQKCIKSILIQSYEHVEVIVVDDGSKREYQLALVDLLEKYPKIIYFSKLNGGVASARNLGIKKSTGTFISFIDPDDTYHKDKLLIQTSLLVKNQNFFAVAGGSITTYIKRGKSKVETIMPIPINGNCFPLILYGFLGIHSTPNYLFRKTALINIGEFDERLIINEDRDLIYRLSKLYPILTHQDIVCEVFKSKNSLSNKLNKIKLESKLIFFNKIINDLELTDETIKSRYARKYIILKVILNENYKEFRNSIDVNFQYKLDYKGG